MRGNINYQVNLLWEKVDGINTSKAANRKNSSITGQNGHKVSDSVHSYNSKDEFINRPKDEPTNIFCLPSGGYREPKGFYAQANIELVEGKDFKRVISIKKDGKICELPTKTILLTAISKPKRLLEFLPENTEMISFADHYTFTKDDILKIEKEYKDYAIITTGKDFVKLKEFDIKNLYLMDLDIEISSNVDFTLMDEYINSFNK
jgi:tetraacyldisaccharide 4'-kinase